jgi:hypothetical protein
MSHALPFVGGIRRRRAHRARDPSVALLETEAMRARRHPWAIAGLWLWETALALAVSLPVATSVRTAFGDGRLGDASLWRPGGRDLLDFLWHAVRALAPVATSAEIVLVVAAIAGLVPACAAMVAMAYATRDGRHVGLLFSLSAALEKAPAFLLLWAIVTTAQAGLLGAGAAIIGAVDAWVRSGLGGARTQRLDVAIGVVFVLAASGVGVAHDLARAAVVRFDVGAWRALTIGSRGLDRAPLPVWWSWAWRAAASTLPVLAAALMSMQLGGRGGWALCVLALAHQSAVLSRVALRASWLGCALRTVEAEALSLESGSQGPGWPRRPPA